MALSLKTLYADTLGNSEALLYPNPASQATKNALIKNFILTNKSGSAATVNLRLRKSNTATYVQVSPKDLSIPAGGQVVLDAEITIDLNQSTPNAIYGGASATTAIDCIINGLERDV